MSEALLKQTKVSIHLSLLSYHWSPKRERLEHMTTRYCLQDKHLLRDTPCVSFSCCLFSPFFNPGPWGWHQLLGGFLEHNDMKTAPLVLCSPLVPFGFDDV